MKKIHTPSAKPVDINYRAGRAAALAAQASEFLALIDPAAFPGGEWEAAVAAVTGLESALAALQLAAPKGARSVAAEVKVAPREVFVPGAPPVEVVAEEPEEPEVTAPEALVWLDTPNPRDLDAVA